MGKTKKNLERKEKIYQILGSLGEKRKGNGNQMQAGVDVDSYVPQQCWWKPPFPGTCTPMHHCFVPWLFPKNELIRINL